MSHEDSAAAINNAHVSVTVPPFWRAISEIWLRQFILAGITIDITKFHRVISELQPKELDIVGDIILNLPAKDSTAFRTRLCSKYADSEQQHLLDLISGMQLGDRKPSRFLLETVAYTRAADIGYLD
ncbi:peptidase A2 domain-containing protein [Nephila pilipes]|uniref:Peptidase A2 domain-containing protein n=1 Tax=Nephila pilipes TaxID=299642 RepID=A0A8X6Q7P0_NEPPI|nr:peptidase A2 domain-containing protein [Nephila pilipes]